MTTRVGNVNGTAILADLSSFNFTQTQTVLITGGHPYIEEVVPGYPARPQGVQTVASGAQVTLWVAEAQALITAGFATLVSTNNAGAGQHGATIMSLPPARGGRVFYWKKGEPFYAGLPDAPFVPTPIGGGSSAPGVTATVKLRNPSAQLYGVGPTLYQTGTYDAGSGIGVIPIPSLAGMGTYSPPADRYMTYERVDMVGNTTVYSAGATLTLPAGEAASLVSADFADYV